MNESLTSLQRQKYFSSLTQGTLVTLLVKATTLNPELPVFEPAFKGKIQNSMTNGHSHTITNLPSQPAATTAPSIRPPPDPAAVADDANYTPDVHPSNYPRPGEGLMKTLPPEQEDLQWLVEDDDKYGVFTHLYQTSATTAGAQQTTGDDG